MAGIPCALNTAYGSDMCVMAREETGRVGRPRETLGGLWQVWGMREVAKTCDPSRFSWALAIAHSVSASMPP